MITMFSRVISGELGGYQQERQHGMKTYELKVRDDETGEEMVKLLPSPRTPEAGSWLPISGKMWHVLAVSWLLS